MYVYPSRSASYKNILGLKGDAKVRKVCKCARLFLTPVRENTHKEWLGCV